MMTHQSTFLNYHLLVTNVERNTNYPRQFWEFSRLWSHPGICSLWAWSPVTHSGTTPSKTGLASAQVIRIVNYGNGDFHKARWHFQTCKFTPAGPAVMRETYRNRPGIRCQFGPKQGCATWVWVFILFGWCGVKATARTQPFHTHTHNQLTQD